MTLLRTLCLLLAVAVCAGTPASLAQEVLNNESVLRMVEAGLSEALIVMKIESSPGDYRLDADTLVELKSRGVSDTVLQAMLAKGKAQPAPPQAEAAGRKDAPAGDYELLATNRTSTMEKEMNQTAQNGHKFVGLTFGETTFGSNEVIVIMKKDPEARFEYKLLATNKTSTMDKEINQMAAQGFYVMEASFGETAGGQELLVVMERARGDAAARFQYKLLATTKTGTLRREINAFAAEGYRVLDVTYGDTTFGGKEVIAVLELARQP